MSEDIRLDLLINSIAKSKLDNPTKNALADDLKYVQDINGTKDPALLGIKRLVISGVRREILAVDRAEMIAKKIVNEHMITCPGGAIPKTFREFFIRLGSQYPLLIIIIVILLIKQYGFEWLLKIL